MVEWQQAGYIAKIINKWYLFTDLEIDEFLRTRISNCLVRPSYISLQTALSFHGLIPEGVYTFTSVTTRKTMRYETAWGNFVYRSVKPQLFFGYHADHTREIPVLMAEPEKAILDFLYLSPTLHSVADLNSLRINRDLFDRIIDPVKLQSYATCFESATLKRRLSLLNKSLRHADPL
jgi:predicted transcriptional regulator of viral defense system